MTPPMFGQDWRQAMRAPQMNQQPQGSMFPTRGPGGGWQMPAQMPVQGPTSVQPPPAPPPMMGQQPQSFMNSQVPAHLNANLYPGLSMDFWKSQMPMSQGFGAGGNGGYGGYGPGIGNDPGPGYGDTY